MLAYEELNHSQNLLGGHSEICYFNNENAGDRVTYMLARQSWAGMPCMCVAVITRWGTVPGEPPN